MPARTHIHFLSHGMMLIMVTILQNAFELAFFFWLLVSILLTFPNEI
jgi:hypothetical protein